MAEITQAYVEARREAISWLNSAKKDYNTGVAILTKSGYKPVVASKLSKLGERAHTCEKLEYEIRQMIQVWYHPDDPRFENVDLTEDAMPGEDGREEIVPEEIAVAIVLQANNEQAKESDEQAAYPPVIAKVIYEFRDCYNERSRLHRQLSELGEMNTEVVVTQRKSVTIAIRALSARMTKLADIKKRYETDQTIPTDEELDELYADSDAGDDKEKKEDNEVDINMLSVDDLKKAKSNAKSKITKAKNILLYSSEKKPADGKENPLPDCPKRVKYEKKVADQESLVEKIEYKLAELQ